MDFRSDEVHNFYIFDVDSSLSKLHNGTRGNDLSIYRVSQCAQFSKICSLHFRIQRVTAIVIMLISMLYVSQIEEDFIPIIWRIKATMAPLGGPKGEILYAREHEAVWFKGKRFAPSVMANTQLEEKIKHLRPALDSKGKKVGEEWFTTNKVEDALTR